MQKDDFEKNIKRVVESGSIEPPNAIWEAISTHLEHGAPLEHRLAESFAHAEKAPKAEAWDNIAKALDEGRKPIFFNRYSLVGIAALLLLTLGWFTFNSYWLPSSQGTSQSGTGDADISRSMISGGGQAKARKKRNIEPRMPVLKSIPSIPQKYKRGAINNLAEPIEKIFFLGKSKDSKPKPSPIRPKAIKNNRPFFEFANSFVLKRNKLAFYDELTPRKRINKKSRSWLGVQTAFSPFDPNIKIQNLERATITSASDAAQFFSHSVAENGVKNNDNKGKTFAIPLTQPYAIAKSGTGFSIGLDYGKHFNRYFSWQGGLSYYSGNSYLNSNVYSQNQYTGEVQTFVESYYIRQSTSVFDNVVVSKGTFVDNDYKYLIAPIQLVFHLPLTQKMELAVASGISTNFFINNVLDNLPERGSKLTAANSSYKLAYFSGIGTLKASYMIGQHWQMFLGTSFQQTISSGVKKAEGIIFKPRYLGIGTGLNYRFD